MAHYKRVYGVKLQDRSDSEREVLSLLNRYAALRDTTVHKAMQELLIEVLPARIKRATGVDASKDAKPGKRASRKQRMAAG